MSQQKVEDPHFICALELEMITSLHSPPTCCLPEGDISYISNGGHIIRPVSIAQHQSISL